MPPQPVRAHLGTAAGCHRLKGRPGGGSPAPLLRGSGARPQPPGAAAPSPPRVTARPWSSAEPRRRDRRAREMAARWALRRRGRGAPGLRGLPAAAVLAARPRRRPEGGRVPQETGKTPGSGRPLDGWRLAARGSAGPVRAASCPPRPPRAARAARAVVGSSGAAAAGKAGEAGRAGPPLCTGMSPFVQLPLCRSGGPAALALRHVEGILTAFTTASCKAARGVCKVFAAPSRLRQHKLLQLWAGNFYSFEIL